MGITFDRLGLGRSLSGGCPHRPTRRQPVTSVHQGLYLSLDERWGSAHQQQLRLTQRVNLGSGGAVSRSGGANEDCLHGSPVSSRRPDREPPHNVLSSIAMFEDPQRPTTGRALLALRENLPRRAIWSLGLPPFIQARSSHNRARGADSTPEQIQGRLVIDVTQQWR